MSVRVQDPLNVVRQRDVEGIRTSVLGSSYMCSYGNVGLLLRFTLLDDTMPEVRKASEEKALRWRDTD